MPTVIVRHSRRGLLVAAALAAVATPAMAQIATLDKGHSILVNNGLQIWGANTNVNAAFDYNTMAGANMNGVIWGFPAVGMSNVNALSPGQKWGRWTDWQYNGTPVTPQTALTAAENAHKNDLIALQVGDEINQSDMETGTKTRDWLLAAGNGTSTTGDDVFPNSLLYVNSFHIINHANYANFLQTANPDAISWDSYPFANPHGHYITPTNWLALGQQFRRHGLGSYIGASNAAPRPYGLFLQTYNDTFAIDPGEVQMRWQQFAAWTMGYKFVDAFIYLGNNTNFGTNPSGSVYQGFKETARQSRNLGPALTRLISTGYGTSIVPGKNSAGATNPIPGDWLPFHKDNAPVGQRYLTNISATNLGTKNGGHAGDVYVGFFNPLHASFGNPAGTAYFMVMNGLGGDLTLPNGQSDNTATVAETTQQLTLDFDMSYKTLNSLQRLNRNTGQLEVLSLTHVSGTQYRLTFNLEGGSGDLFKYYDGHVFVGAETVKPTVYWDADANASGNNATTGAGLGGNGNWNMVGTRFYNGTTNGIVGPQLNVVFTGTAGTVNVDPAMTVDSLTFKTNGYTIQGDRLTLNRPFVTVDANVVATINNVVAGTIGLNKDGPGRLILGGTNTFIGGTTITGGIVQAKSDAALGPAPSTLVTNISLDGGTLQLGGNFDLNNNRGIGLGPAGGTIDTNGFSNSTGYGVANSFRGPGNLTKVGTGTFYASATTGGATTLWTGNLILKEGTWKIRATDGLPFNAPVTNGLQAAQVTFDGGTLQMAATINVTNGRRGITVTDNGGTIDTQGFNFTWAGPMAGTSPLSNANLIKIGNGILRLNSASGVPGSYNGNVNINAGTLHLDGGLAMGNGAAVNLANAAGVTLNITGNETIGSLAGGGSSGGVVTLTSGTLDVGRNGRSTTLDAVVSGAGGITKAGSASTLTLAGANTYAGGTTVIAGTLVAANASAFGTGSLVINDATARVEPSLPKALTIESITTTGTGSLDLTNNAMVVKNSNLSTVAAMVAQGFNSGDWLGAGITSSIVAADPNSGAAVGFATAADLEVNEFVGVSGLDGNDVLVLYTTFGDSNLSGATDLDDFPLYLFGLEHPEALQTWYYGDYNYNGVVDLDDFPLFIAGYETQLNTLSALAEIVGEAGISSAERQFMLSAIAAVPEPGGMIGGAVAIVVIGRKRRKFVAPRTEPGRISCYNHCAPLRLTTWNPVTAYPAN